MRSGRTIRHRPLDTGSRQISLEPEDTPPVVVSLTSHPARYGYLHKALRGLLGIDYPALTIEAFLTDSPPRRVARMAERDARLNICQVDRDFGPATKYLYALERHPERLVIVCDDDHAYTSRWLRTLVAWSLQLGGEACVACTGMAELAAIDRSDPGVAGALESAGGVTAEGVEVYRKVHGEKLRGDPVPLLWPQGYTGYLLPRGLSTRLDVRRHYEECLDLMPPDQLQDMEGRLNDDAVMGAFLHRLGTPKVVVPHDNDPRPLKRVTRVESFGALQERFHARYGMNISVAMYLALRERGWL